MRNTASILVVPCLSLVLGLVGVQAASVGTGGYTNDFSVQPGAADWSSYPIPGGQADITMVGQVGPAVQLVTAATINSQTFSDATIPPAFNALATWSSAGFYLQTRPTGNQITLLMCTLVNGLGGDANSVTIGYDFTITAPNGDEIAGHNVYYSLTGATGSWVAIPTLANAASSGRLTATLPITWPSGSALYIVWADDNSVNSPDTANQIDNFSASATPSAQVPADITLHPQSQSVGELQPVTLTGAASGNPPPTLQWLTNGVAIPGATGTSYGIAAAPLHYNGLNFRLVAENTASNVNYSVTSTVATLTVNADLTAPVLLGALPSGLLQVVASFSERLAPDSVTNVAHYAISGMAGTLIISNATLDASQTNVVLTVSPMTSGSLYTLTVNGVTDPSAAANRVATNSQAQFTAADIATANIGNPNPPGQATLLIGGANVTAAGSDIGGTSDQFTFVYQPLAGDFDIKVRVQGLVPTDVWAKAGLMAREDVSTNSRYSASFATPGLSGCFFQYRATNGSASGNAGSFPVAYPSTWLRLKRAGNTFTGYAGLDGSGWSQLGSTTISGLPTSLLVGFAVTGRGAQTTAQFRDYDSVMTVSTLPIVLPREPLGPSSRKTSFAITEILYHPRTVPGSTTSSLEFIEIYNSNPFPENIGNHRLSGAIDYTFAPNTSVPGGGFLVVARDPVFVQSRYGLSSVLGPWAGTNLAGMSTNGLPGGSGTIRLRNSANAVLLEVNYEGDNPWPIAADGAGHSLVLARGSYGEDDPRAWAASDAVDGSPGGDDPYGSDRLRPVVINEFLANTDATNLLEFIELYNHGNADVDLSGAYLSDESSFIQNPAVTNHYYRFPNGTSIPARGFLSVTQFAAAFSLSASGERIYLVNSNQTRVIDVVRYEAQGNGVSMGRWPDGAAAWYRMASRTPGAANSGQRYSPVVINELMIEPISGESKDEYVELYNGSGGPLDVSNWRFVEGINYHIPTNTIIPNNGYLVIAASVTNCLAKYANLNSGNTRGDYSGSLRNSGDRIALAMPETNVTATLVVTTNGGMAVTNTVLVTNTLYIIVNEVTYGPGGRWGTWSHGGGSSLELRDPRSDNRLAANWADSDESAKGIWTTIEITNAISNPMGTANDNLQVFLLGVGECLVDDIEVRNTPAGPNLIVNNPGFETGAAAPISTGTDLGGWTAQGSHDQSSFENTGFTGSRSLHLRAASRGDNGGNRVRSPALSPVASGSTVVLRARAKWIRGWPELLLRVHGGGLEVGGYLPMQHNLGTPGLPNSRLLANAGPAVYSVLHAPILPAPSEAVTVTARVTDPDPSVTLRLKYRIDPSTAYTSLTMTDDGTNGVSGDAIAGDGIFSAKIPGQNAGVTVPFYIEAVDGPGATNTFPVDLFPSGTPRVFPRDATTRECVVRWGDTNMLGSFSTYHVWLSVSNTARWNTRRPVLNNGPLDATFVYNNARVIYNLTPLYAGSPWHRGAMQTGPDGNNRVDFTINFPEDDPFLGASSAVWNNPGNPGAQRSGAADAGSTTDTSAQTEQTTYIMFRELAIHYNYRRYVHVFVNGSQRSKTAERPGNFIFEDSQQANGDVIAEWSSDDTDGQLFKIEDWFEFPDDGDNFTINNDADLIRRNVTGTTNIDIAAARYMYRNRARGTAESANDYTNLVDLLNVVSPAGSGLSDPLTNQLAQLNAIMDVEQWMRTIACQHTAGNWDSYGYRRGKNCYTYKPRNGLFQLWTWDIDFTMGVGGDGTGQDVFDNGGGSPDGDERMGAMFNTPAIRRAYLRALEDIVNGPLNNSYMDPILDAKAAAMAANNINYNPATVTDIKNFIAGRRTYILNTPLNGMVGNLFNASVNGATNFGTNLNYVILSGSAPVSARYIYVNGVAVPVTWTSVLNWTARVALSNGVNTLNVQAYTSRGTPTNAARTVVITNSAIVADPVGNVIFNEVLYQPLIPDASFVEVFNLSTTTAFDIGGWRINGLDFEFPGGTVLLPRQFAVVPKSMPAYAFAFGFAVVPAGEFSGNLDPDGETLTLLKPATTNSPEVVIDKFRYENQAPWPVILPGSDISLQLIDPQQDNARVSNWAANRGLWSYVTYTGLIQSNGTSFLIYMPLGAGDVYIDDLVLVTNIYPEVGPNLLQNGSFEDPLTGTWATSGNHITSAASTMFAHSGNSSLHVVATSAGSAAANIKQIIAPFLTSNVCTLSFWFLPTTNGTALTIRTTPGSGFNPPPPYFNLQPRVNPNSPGTTNQTIATRPPYDPVWLNELQAENPSGITDNMGEREPWIELYNSGPVPIDMSGYYLANTYASNNLTQWQFPAGYTLAPGEFRVVWADAQFGQTSGTNAHTNFRLAVGNGNVALSRLVSGQPQITDYLTYTNLRSGLSYGDFPDGQPVSRRVFQTATGGGTNNSRDINVFVNEWLASNFSFLPDPTDGQYDDWFELYNAGDTAVDLGGYYLTDNTNQPTKFHIPNNEHYVIPAGGFLLVWADNDSNDNSTNTPDLHVNFSLDAMIGEAIGLYAPDGFTRIDSIAFGPQSNNISEGRYADGAAGRYFMATPTPRAANVIAGGNTPPVLDPLADRTLRLGQSVNFTATATDAEAGQSLTFSLSGPVAPGAFINAAGQFSWTPSPAQVSTTNTFTVVVTDNGPGALGDSDAFTVIVLPPPVAMVTGNNGVSVTIGFDTIPGRSYRLYAKTNIDDPMWLPLSAPVLATGESLTIDDNIGPGQRFYKVFQVD